jgi:hypothetical protein
MMGIGHQLARQEMRFYKRMLIVIAIYRKGCFLVPGTGFDSVNVIKNISEIGIS